MEYRGTSPTIRMGDKQVLLDGVDLADSVPNTTPPQKTTGWGASGFLSFCILDGGDESERRDKNGRLTRKPTVPPSKAV